jgi:hypothetical protein
LFPNAVSLMAGAASLRTPYPYSGFMGHSNFPERIG